MPVSEKAGDVALPDAVGSMHDTPMRAAQRGLEPGRAREIVSSATAIRDMR